MLSAVSHPSQSANHEVVWGTPDIVIFLETSFINGSRQLLYLFLSSIPLLTLLLSKFSGPAWMMTLPKINLNVLDVP